MFEMILMAASALLPIWLAWKGFCIWRGLKSVERDLSEH